MRDNQGCHNRRKHLSAVLGEGLHCNRAPYLINNFRPNEGLATIRIRPCGTVTTTYAEALATQVRGIRASVTEILRRRHGNW